MPEEVKIEREPRQRIHNSHKETAIIVDPEDMNSAKILKNLKRQESNFSE
jgi:hypothetical protein